MDALRTYMQQNGLTQTALAAQLGVTQGAVGHWLNGRYKPDAAVCIRLEQISDGQLRACDLRPDLFPSPFTVATA